MKSHHRQKQILVIAIRQQEEKETQLAQALRLRNQAEKQLLQLKTYRNEYHGDLSSSESINISQLINKQRFISQLDVAIAAQHEKASNIQSLTQRHEKAWHHARNRRDALENLLDKRMEALRKKIERYEQIEQDNRVYKAGNG
jgi:flagellar FliJ protein